MERFVSHFLVLFSSILFCYQEEVLPKTKLCGNADCTAILFEGRVIRNFANDHPEFLNRLMINAKVNVVAIKFSDRGDLWEGKLDDGFTGRFYSSYIDYEGFLQFIRLAVKEDRLLFIHNQEKQNIGNKNLIGETSSKHELLKDLEAIEIKNADDKRIKMPELEHLLQVNINNDHFHGNSHANYPRQHEFDTELLLPELESENKSISNTNKPTDSAIVDHTLSSTITPPIVSTNQPIPETTISTNIDSTAIEPSISTNPSPIEPVTVHAESIKQSIPETTISTTVDSTAIEPSIATNPSPIESVTVHAESIKQSIPETTISTTVDSTAIEPSISTNPSPIEPVTVHTESTKQSIPETTISTTVDPTTFEPSIATNPSSIELVTEPTVSTNQPIPETTDPTTIPPVTLPTESSQKLILEFSTAEFASENEDLPPLTWSKMLEWWKIFQNLSNTCRLFAKRVLFSWLRHRLPSHLNSLDDSGLIILFVFPLTLIFYFSRSLLSSDPRQEKFDKRRYFDLINLRKALMIDNGQLKESIRLMERENAILKETEIRCKETETQLVQLEHHFGTLKRRNEQLESDDVKMSESLKQAEKNAEDQKRALVEKSNECGDLIRNATLFETQGREFRQAFEKARNEMDSYKNELHQKNIILERMETDEKQLRVDLRRLGEENKTHEEEIRHLLSRNEVLQGESAQLSEMLDAELIKNDCGNAVRNGSDGWLDIGDSHVKDENPSKMGSTFPSDLICAARLRAQIKKLDSNLETAKLTSQKDRTSQEFLESRLKMTDEEIEKRQIQLDQKEQERLQVHAQCLKLFTMIEEKDGKIIVLNEMIEKMRNKHDETVQDLRHIQDEKKLLEDRIKDLEQDVKRMRRENERLETRNFHEIKEMKSQNSQLQKLYNDLSTATESSHQMNEKMQDMLTMGSNNSSEPEMRMINMLNQPADYVQKSKAKNALKTIVGTTNVPSLWREMLLSDEWHGDSPPRPENMGSNKSNSRNYRGKSEKNSPTDDDIRMRGWFSSSGDRDRNNTGCRSRKNRQRTPDLSSTAPFRHRSRSRPSTVHPSHIYVDGIHHSLPQSSSLILHKPSALNYEPRVMDTNRRPHHEESASSPGSGPSPPPEMPLVSGVPPPGVNRKPELTGRHSTRT